MNWRRENCTEAAIGERKIADYADLVFLPQMSKDELEERKLYRSPHRGEEYAADYATSNINFKNKFFKSVSSAAIFTGDNIWIFQFNLC
jgi:hypothetical protein